ncbi:response regulator transcription factor [Dyadobacter aurulentus]|uniref:response regulator transcription factor n=1 Tax=Dyadobacter sp. UC 10 TaxID=2605428 RepID=UPI001788E6CD|nr:response regulator transcription factor [Dyadobacter sp. UC 10]
MIQIGIIDAFPIIRIGLTILLKEAYKDAEILAASNLDSFLSEHRNIRARAVIIGICENAKEDKLLMIRQFRNECPQVPLMIYDHQFQPELVPSYFMSGVTGYVLKHQNENQMLTCLNRILKGEHYLSPELTSNFVQRIVENDKNPTRHQRRLTPYEFEIAVRLCRGQSSPFIAEKLGRKPTSISSARKTIFRKLNIHSIVDLRKAINLDPEQA